MKKNRLSICLIIPYYQKMYSSFYTLEIIKEVSKAGIRYDVDLLIDTTWRANNISGILFADLMGNELLIKKARAKKIPYLILNYYSKEAKDNCIGIDNRKAGFEAVNYLIEAGHRRIATITGKLDAQAGLQRLEGFKEALKKKHIELDKRYIVNGDWTRDSGSLAMKKLLNFAHPPTAVFVAGDEMAIGAIEETRDAGLKVPENVSFVGFDNIPQADLGGIPLTTVEQPLSELAELGIKNLLQIIRKKPKQPVKILLGNAKLIKKESVKVLAK